MEGAAGVGIVQRSRQKACRGGGEHEPKEK
jgi:hypothetical protein